MNIRALLHVAALSAVSAVTLGGCSSGNSIPAGSAYAGEVYAQTNNASGNAIVRYGRGSDGSLTYLSTTPTGGNGIGAVNVVNGSQSVDPLFSSNSLFLTPDHSRLLAVNAGSNSITSFAVGGDGGLHLIGTYPTGGNTPTTIAVHGTTVYVGHAKTTTGNIQLTGFTMNADGSLSAISGAHYAPSGATVVAQVAFSPDGTLLEMSELMTNKIDMYPVHADGTLGTPVVNASAGGGPFGAAFVDQTHLVVAEAAPMAAAVSSYSVAPNGAITAISASVKNGQTATCWVRVSADGRYVYGANTGSGNVSAYAVGSGGTLALINATQAAQAGTGAVGFMGGATTSGSVDAVISNDGRYYYQQYSGLGLVQGYSINSDGTLTTLANAAGTQLPTVGAEGVAGF